MEEERGEGGGRRQKPRWLLALGREAPPAEIEVGGERFRLGWIYKHDFFAFTARYDAVREGAGPADAVVLKIGRKAWFFVVPLGWIGRLHAWHESRVFERLQDLPIVPRFRGRWGAHGLTHAFIVGHELKKKDTVPDDFFARLEEGLLEIHARGMAYVDLEKPENVLVGADGCPYLFDFQIAWCWPRRLGGNLPPFLWLRRSFQRSDRYHLLKLRRLVRPDQMTPDELAASRHRPLHVRLHNWWTRPLTRLRRRVLDHLDPDKRRGERGRVH